MLLDERLLPCPFCGGTETRIDELKHWTGMGSIVVSVTIRHFCSEDIFKSTIQCRAKTEEEAIVKWNSRVGAYAA